MSARSKRAYSDEELLDLMRRVRRYEDMTEFLSAKVSFGIAEFMASARHHFSNLARGDEDIWLRKWLEHRAPRVVHALRHIPLEDQQRAKLASDDEVSAYVERVLKGLPDPPEPFGTFPWEIDERDLG